MGKALDKPANSLGPAAKGKKPSVIPDKDLPKDEAQSSMNQEMNVAQAGAGESGSESGSESGGDKPEKVPYGQQYTKKNGKKALKPDITYETPEGYKYTTDSKGRICSVEGILQKGTSKRNNYAQQNVGKGDGRRDGTDGLGKDDGGHLIASIFKGSGNIDNLVPMDSNLNRGRWKTMENLWATVLENDKNAKIEVNIMAEYGEDTQRPTAFFVSYRINDGDWVDDFYENERSQ